MLPLFSHHPHQYKQELTETTSGQDPQPVFFFPEDQQGGREAKSIQMNKGIQTHKVTIVYMLMVEEEKTMKREKNNS